MRENDFLRYLMNQPAAARSDVSIGIGDDMAGVRLRGNDPLALLKIDQVLDGVHVDRTTQSAEAIGRKAVNRCLSDCAAMACSPSALLLSFALPQGIDEAFAHDLYRGAAAAGAVFDCPIVGGDTAIWDQRLVITVAALGTSTAAPVRRCGAQPGDVIVVSGELGGSILGRHLTFEPRIKLAQAITAAVPIHAMMDLSDGLLTDLPRLCERSNVGALVRDAVLPVHADARTLAARDGKTPEFHALSDGEDYELLMCLDREDWDSIRATDFGVPLRMIGRIISGHTLVLSDEHEKLTPWPIGGWEYGREHSRS